MHVVATAGHVDHGKSTLIKALTGAHPDRLVEEHRRGLSIELGYCWTDLGGVGDVAFVDVPGHERFLATMLAGVGPVPAVLFVVAADDDWMPQAAEHLAALDALGVESGVVAITRSDLVDPQQACDRAARELGGTTLRNAALVAVSARTGEGLPQLRAELATMLATLPPQDPAADVRLWVDRRFTVRGAGVVVTGTLQSGTISEGDWLTSESGRVRVRGVQALEQPVPRATGVARVALNITGEHAVGIDRGEVLVPPDTWHFTDVVDVRLTTSEATRRPPTRPPSAPQLHVGAAALPVSCRLLGHDIARLRMPRRMPLRLGDRAVLRDPGNRALWGVRVLDPAPPELRRRGAAADRARVLDSADGHADLAAEVERRRLVSASLLQRIGVPVPASDAGTDGWLVSPAGARGLSQQLERLVDEHDRRSPLDPGISLQTLAQRLELPSVELVRALVPAGLVVIDGRARRPGTALPAAVEEAVRAVECDLADAPFAAPSADRLRELGLDHKGIAVAAKAGRLLRLSEGVVLLPDADRLAASYLAELRQPFTTSEARQRLGATRRVVLPLLQHLDRQRLTTRLADDRRTTATTPR